VALGAAAAGAIHPAGIAVLSGFLPTGCEPRALAGLPVFWSHGIKDSLVTVDQARADSRRLEVGGAQLTYCEADVGHKVGLPCVRGLRAWLVHLERDSNA
jgi:predicted esterase